MLNSFASLIGIKKIVIEPLVKHYGEIDFSTATIFIDRLQSTEWKIAILCHELGHWIVYRLGLHSEDRYSSEGMADFVGNLVRIFVAGRKNCSRRTWTQFKAAIVRN